MSEETHQGERLIQIPVTATLRETEKHLFIASLEHHQGNRRATASTLGIGVRTLQRRLSDWGMEDYLRIDKKPGLFDD